MSGCGNHICLVILSENNIIGKKLTSVWSVSLQLQIRKQHRTRIYNCHITLHCSMSLCYTYATVMYTYATYATYTYATVQMRKNCNRKSYYILKIIVKSFCKLYLVLIFKLHA